LQTAPGAGPGRTRGGGGAYSRGGGGAPGGRRGSAEAHEVNSTTDTNVLRDKLIVRLRYQSQRRQREVTASYWSLCEGSVGAVGPMRRRAGAHKPARDSWRAARSARP